MNMRVEGTVEIFPLCSDQGLLLLEEQFYMQIQTGQKPMSKNTTKTEVSGGNFNKAT